ncbi:MAG: ankyrin repeat domain-containing protein [Ekhidna sp.]
MKNLQKKNHLITNTFILLILLITSCESSGQKSEESKPEGSIHEAAFMGNVKLMKAHIATKSDLNEKDEYGSSPLTITCIFNKTEVAKLLIEAGADLNIKSGDGSTPLHSAAFFCRTDIVKMLLKKGADTSIRNNYGSTAMESISGPFADVKPFYDQMSKDLGPFGLKLDYERIESTRPVIVEMIKASN